MTAKIAAATGDVNQEVTILATPSQFQITVPGPYVAIPIPMIAPTMEWVVETGTNKMQKEQGRISHDTNSFPLQTLIDAHLGHSPCTPTSSQRKKIEYYLAIPST